LIFALSKAKLAEAEAKQAKAEALLYDEKVKTWEASREMTQLAGHVADLEDKLHLEHAKATQRMVRAAAAVLVPARYDDDMVSIGTRDSVELQAEEAVDRIVDMTADQDPVYEHLTARVANLTAYVENLEKQLADEHAKAAQRVVRAAANILAPQDDDQSVLSRDSIEQDALGIINQLVLHSADQDPVYENLVSQVKSLEAEKAALSSRAEHLENKIKLEKQNSERLASALLMSRNLAGAAGERFAAFPRDDARSFIEHFDGDSAGLENGDDDDDQRTFSGEQKSSDSSSAAGMEFVSRKVQPPRIQYQDRVSGYYAELAGASASAPSSSTLSRRGRGIKTKSAARADPDQVDERNGSAKHNVRQRNRIRKQEAVQAFSATAQAKKTFEEQQRSVAADGDILAWPLDLSDKFVGAVFEKFDVDKSGDLSVFELSKAAAELLGRQRPLSTVQVSAMVAASGLGGFGTGSYGLSLQAFTRLVRNFDWAGETLKAGLGEGVFEYEFVDEALGFSFKHEPDRGIITVARISKEGLRLVLHEDDTILAVNGAPLGFVSDPMVSQRPVVYKHKRCCTTRSGHIVSMMPFLFFFMFFSRLSTNSSNLCQGLFESRLNDP
jgi:prefoldin subunit 5